MIDGKKLSEVGFRYIGTPYDEMDCQAFVERCLKDCGDYTNLSGSNAWYREVMKNGWVGTPEDCIRLQGEVPKGAFLFILSKVSDTTPQKYRDDGIGDANHIGIVTHKGEGAIHSSRKRGGVCQSEFHDKTIKNGGWNRVGLWNRVDYGLEPVADDSQIPGEDGFPDDAGWHPTLRKGSKGDEVILLQTMLYKLGYDLGSWGIDGDYGKDTVNAVKEYQDDRGLTVDGVCGPMTWDSLQKDMEKLNATPKHETYMAIIRHLDKLQADAIKRSFPNCEISKE